MLEHRELYLNFHQSEKWILALILPFWQPFRYHISGLICASLQHKWLYSMCKEVEYISPQTARAHIISQLSSDWIMRCGSTLMLLRLQFQQRKKKKEKKKKRSEGNAVFIISALMYAVSDRGSCVSLYTSSGRLSNLLWWTWVCVVNPANDLWLTLSQSHEHALTSVKACLLLLFWVFVFLNWKFIKTFMTLCGENLFIYLEICSRKRKEGFFFPFPRITSFFRYGDCYSILLRAKLF